MERNKVILSLTVMAAILMITIPTILKIVENHQEKLMIVATKKIVESAENCYYDNVCKMNQMTLGQLKNTGYLETDIVNPKTKTYFENNLLLVYEENHVRIAQ